MSENHMNESGRAGGSGDVCLDVQDLKMHFKLKSGLFSKPKILKAVDGVSFTIGKGETMGLVGESGCGKTTVGRSILRLYEATDGKIIFQGTDITHFTDAQMLPYRKKMQMIFQDPYTSLDPRKNIGDIIEEPMWALKLYEGKDRRDRVRELIDGIETFLGWKNTSEAFLIGASGFGAGLLEYEGFAAYGLKIIAAFDRRATGGGAIHDVPLFGFSELRHLAARLRIRLAILCVPDDEAQETAEFLVDCGILAIWNFTAHTLKLPEKIICQRVNLGGDLAILSVKLGERLNELEENGVDLEEEKL